MAIHDQENFCSNHGSSSSSFHFNSFLGLLTSDDDDDVGNGDDDADQDTYIEIALESPQLPFSQSPPHVGEDQEDRPLNYHDQEEELQLRISFSSRVFPFPGLSSLPTTSFCSDDDGVHGSIDNSCPDDQAIICDRDSYSYTQGKPKIRFRAALSRLLGFFPTNFNISTRSISWELVGSRGEAAKNHTTTPAGRSGVVGNFLVKLKTTNFQTMRASLLKLLQYTSSSSTERENMSRRDIINYHQLKKPRKAHQMLIVKPFKKLIGSMQNIPRESQKIGSRPNDPDGSGDVGVLLSMKRAVNIRKGKEVKPKSCPASVRSSPTKEHFCYELQGSSGGSSQSQNMHHFARDNSVQAAIAHCKKSMGGADDFHF